MLRERFRRLTPTNADIHGPGDGLPVWLPAAVYALVVAVLLGPSLFGGQVVLPHDLLTERLPWSDPIAAPEPANPEQRDVIDQYYPVQRLLWTRLRAGQDVTWIRDLSYGSPGVQFVGFGALSPFNWPAAVLPFDVAWSWGMALRLLTAMAGAHLLARSYGVGRAGATIAGLSFGLSGFMVGWLAWPTAHAAAWIPWVCLAARRAAGADPPWWAVPGLALVTAALWLGGFPIVAVYALITAGVVTLHRAAEAAEWTARLRRLVAPAAGVMLGTGLVAFTLVPSAAFLGELDLAVREQSWRASVHPLALYTFIAPRVFGDVVTAPFWLRDAYVESVGYAGAVTLLLALPAWLVAPRLRGVWLWSGTGLFFVAMAYGFPPVRAVIRHLPVLSTNPPPRVLSVVGLAIAMLGAFGADALLRSLRSRAGPSRRALVAASVTGFVALAAYAASSPYARVRAEAIERIHTTQAWEAAVGMARSQALLAAAIIAAAAVLIATSVWLARRREATAIRVLGIGLITVVAIDLVVFAAGWNVQTPRDGLLPDAPGLAELAERDPAYRVAGTDDVAMANTHLLYGFPDLRAHSFVTARQREVLTTAGAHFLSPTRWELRSHASRNWVLWLSASSVVDVLAPGDVTVLPATLEPPPDEQPLGPLPQESSLFAFLTADRSGELTGVQLRVGTYDQQMAGDLQVHVTRAGETLTTGEIGLDEVTDNAVATVTLDGAQVARGDDLQVEVALAGRTPDDRPAIYGEAPARPTVGLVFADEEVWPSVELGPVRRFTNPHAVPRVHAVGDVEVAAPGAAKEAVEALGVEGLATAAVVDDRPDLPALPAGGTAEVLDWDADAGTIMATVSSDAGALLTATEAAMEGWRATIDGEDADVVVANHLFVGVVVPPGEHEVVLTHRSPGLVGGVLMSLLALLVLATWVLWSVRRRPGRVSDRASVTDRARRDSDDHEGPDCDPARQRFDER